MLYNDADELTECGACNAFIVKNGVVATPPIDDQILAGITRQIALKALRTDGTIPVEERVITMDQVWDADEVWISSSSICRLEGDRWVSQHVVNYKEYTPPKKEQVPDLALGCKGFLFEPLIGGNRRRLTGRGRQALVD